MNYSSCDECFGWIFKLLSFCLLQQFKWQVKEAHVLARPGASAHTQSHDHSQPITSEQYEHNYHHDAYDHQEDHREELEVEDGEEPIHADSSAILEAELPPPSTTRNLLAKFQSLGTSSAPTPQKTPSLTHNQRKKSTSSDRIDTVREQPEGVEYETRAHPDERYMQSNGDYAEEKSRDPDIVREADRDDEEEMPEEGTTRSLLAKFQSMQTAH